MLSKEAEIVQKGMGHGELSPEVFGQVWEECYKEVSLCRIFRDHPVDTIVMRFFLLI